MFDIVQQTNPIFPALSGWLDYWWVIALALAGFVLISLVSPEAGKRRRGSRRHRTASDRRRARFSRTAKPGQVITGKAYVTAANGLRVRRHDIRFDGLDAPEPDQYAEHQDGYWFNHGKQVKSALIQRIGGERVRVTVNDIDKYGPAIATVHDLDGHDIGRWLVAEGHAIAAYSRRYADVERAARVAKRGMWAHAFNIDPRAWRARRG